MKINFLLTLISIGLFLLILNQPKWTTNFKDQINLIDSEIKLINEFNIETNQMYPEQIRKLSKRFKGIHKKVNQELEVIRLETILPFYKFSKKNNIQTSIIEFYKPTRDTLIKFLKVKPPLIPLQSIHNLTTEQVKNILKAELLQIELKIYQQYLLELRPSLKEMKLFPVLKNFKTMPNYFETEVQIQEYINFSTKYTKAFLDDKLVKIENGILIHTFKPNQIGDYKLNLKVVATNPYSDYESIFDEHITYTIK